MPALLTRISTLPNACFGFAYHGADLVRLGQVGGGVDAFDAKILLDLAALGLDRVGVAEAVDGDIGALFGKSPRDGEADTARRASHDGIACLERHT